MNDLDDYIEGRFDPNNPSNWEDGPEFSSEDLQECLDYAKETNEFEPLENAIYLNDKAKKEVIEELTGLVKVFRNYGMNDTANLICRTRDKLK